MSGRYVDLVPLTADMADDLWPAVQDAPDSFAYLRYGPYDDPAALRDTLTDLANRADQPFWCVRTPTLGACGWLSICDIHSADGNIEIGSIWFSPNLQGSPAAREAIFLLMCHCMDELGYERLVWRCFADNRKSAAAALNLGFTPEGTWRRAAHVKGAFRDVAWFSILRDDWPRVRGAFQAWLAPDNFDTAGRQIRRLNDLR